MELPAVACIKAAEYLVVFQTQYLDADDQALHGTYEQVAQNDHDPVGASSVGRSRQHHDNLHHRRVADCESADTQEGKSVGQIAEQYLEKLEEALDEEHRLLFREYFCFLFHQICERFLEEHQDQRNQEHHSQHGRRRKSVSGDEQEYGGYDGSVKYKSGNRVAVKPCLFHVVIPYGVDDIEHHTDQDDEHTEGNGDDKHGVEGSHKRNIHHGSHGFQPYGVENFLETEEAAVHESEKRWRRYRRS